MPLCQYDFKNFCKLGSLMVSRPTDQCISHEEALQQAHHLAMQWLHPSDAPVDALSNLSSKLPTFLLKEHMLVCCFLLISSTTDYIHKQQLCVLPCQPHDPVWPTCQCLCMLFTQWASLQ